MKAGKRTVAVLVISVVALLILLMVGGVVAESIEIESDISDSWLGRFISKIKYTLSKQEAFTVCGDTLGCASFPTSPSPFFYINGETMFLNPGMVGAQSAFVNIFRGSPYDNQYSEHLNDDRQFLGEYFVDAFNTYSSVCDAGAYWDSDGDGIGECYVDYYMCSNAPCYSDSECSSGEFCDIDALSSCSALINAGVCRISTPTHTTDVYQCEDGTKTYLGDVSSGNVNFCTDPSDTKYLIGTTDRCLDYEPSECYEVPPVNGDVCGDGNIDSGETCSNCPEDVGICPVGDANFEVDIITAPSALIQSGDTITAEVQITNVGGDGTMSVEVGVYKDEDIASWGFAIVQQVSNCEPTEKNVQTKQITLNAGESTTTTYQFIAPTVCRPITNAITEFDLLAVAYINCFNTGQATGVTGSDRWAIQFQPRDDCTGSCSNGIKDGEETDTDCGGSECSKCRVLYKCARTTDCESDLACINGYCSDESARQKGIKASDIKKMTSEDLAQSMCIESAQCQSESSCQSMQWLIDEGHLTDTEADDLVDESAIFLTASGGAIGVGVCAVGVAALSLTTAGGAAILFPLCGVAGGAAGLGLNELIENWFDKDMTKVGYCILEEPNAWCGFASNLALFPITDDDCTDGSIILGIIALFGVMVWSKF